MAPSRRELVPSLLVASSLGVFGLAKAQGISAPVTPQMFGAKADGISDDTAAIQQALLAAKEIYFPQGHYVTSDWLTVPRGRRLRGEGKTSFIENKRIRTSAVEANQRFCVFSAGYWSGVHIGSRPVGSSQPYTRLVDMYGGEGKVQSGDMAVSLQRPGDAKNFHEGDLIFVRDKSSYNQTSTGLETEIPINNSVLRVSRVEALKGKIYFAQPVGFSSDAIYLCRIKPGARDQSGIVSLVDDIVIDGVFGSGWSFLSNETGLVDSKITNVGGDFGTLATFNVFERSILDGMVAKFSHEAIELKLGTADAVIRNIVGMNSVQNVPARISQIEVGEYCRNVLIENFDIRAIGWSGRAPIGLLASKNIAIRNGRLQLPEAFGSSILIYSDQISSPSDFNLSNIQFIDNCHSTLTVDSSKKFPISGLTVSKIEHHSTFTGKGAKSINIMGGSQISVNSIESNLPAG